MGLFNTRSNLVYTADISLSFVSKSETIEIMPENISYIMIDRDYETQILPIIYMNIAVNHSLQNKIVQSRETSKFLLNITRNNENSVINIGKKSISGLFSYLTADTNPNYREDFTDEEDIVGNAYTRMTIGLVSVELSNNLRKTFNNIYKEADVKSLIALGLEGLDEVIVEEIPYNKEFPNIIFPPLTSRNEFLKYLFSKYNFYDTDFRFFMDFDKCYLLSKKGIPTDGHDGQLSSIIVDIRSALENESYSEGIEIKDGSYYLYIHPADSNVIINQGIENVANNLVGVDEAFESPSQMELNINNVEGSSKKDLFLRTDNIALYKNELETNTVTVQLAKQQINGDIFTPNKSILVNNYGSYNAYDGKFLLQDKKEIFKGIGGKFVMSTVVSLKKVNNIVAAQTVSSHASSGYIKSSVQTKSSANLAGTNKSVKAKKK